MLRTVRARISILACLVLLFSSLSAHAPARAAVLGDDYPHNLKSAPSGSADPWGFFVRNCTSFVAWRMNDANGITFTNHMGGGRWSDASNWDDNARALGYRVDNTPAIGSVAHRPTGNHVAWVAQVHSDSTITIEEYNWMSSGTYNSRRVSVSGWQFIHIRDLSPQAQSKTVMTGNNWLLSNYFDAPNSQIRFGFGRAGDIALVGDWDGDGKDTPGVWRAGRWYLTNSPSGNGGSAEISFGFGRSTDIPVVGDWDGDGKDTIGVKRGPYFYLSNDSLNPGQNMSFGFGRSTDIPVVGDWDGDGVDTIGLRRGDMFILSNDADNPRQNMSFGFGRSTDIPVVGDWNNDGMDTVGVFRVGNWYLTNSPSGNSGVGEIRSGYGSSTDIPVTGNWDGYLGDTIGVVR